MSTPTTESPQPNFDSFSSIVQSAIGHVKRFCTSIIEDVVKPSIKTFMETCKTNPRTAAVVATLALLAFLTIVFTFFVLFTLVLVLSGPYLTILIGIAFVIIGGVMSLFKLLSVVLVTIPLAGVAKGPLVFIFNKLLWSISSGLLVWSGVGDMAITFGAQTAQNMQNVVPVLRTICDALIRLAVALNHAVQIAMAGLQQSGTEAPPAAESESAPLNTGSGRRA